MVTTPSHLSLIAAGLYMLVAGGAVLALAAAVARRQARWHWQAWAIMGALFVGLAVMRVLGLEEGLRMALRSAQWMQDNYAQRQNIQRPVLAALVGATLLLAAVLGLRVIPGLRGRRNIAAIIALSASGGMVVLVLVRIISLHSVDAWLYGPFKLNWVLDLGASAAVLIASLAYLVVTRPGR